MSKTLRRLHRNPPSPTSHHPGETHWPITRAETIHMTNKHRRWPLGTLVLAWTAEGPHIGRVAKHWRSSEYPHSCSIEFPFVVDMGDANGTRYCHVVPFRSLCRASARAAINRATGAKP